MFTIDGALRLSLRLVNYAALIIIPYKAWKFLYDTIKEENESNREAILFRKRHDCIVMFSKGRGHVGWFGENDTNLSITNVKWLYEPFLYFIDTAKESLDVAIMSVNVNCIIESLISAQERGVRVRVISNFYMAKKSYDYYKEMQRKGILVTLYVSKEKSNSIMHTKYMVKDYRDGVGYLLTGSFNLTDGAFSNNYEDVVFTSERQMVEDFNENFSLLWKKFTEDNKNVFNRLVLQNAGFSLS